MIIAFLLNFFVLLAFIPGTHSSDGLFLQFFDIYNVNDNSEGVSSRTISQTTQPVIGILTQTLEGSMNKDPKFEKYSSYIMAAYVDFIQASGARVVPILVTDPKEITLQKLKKLNGIFLPGGGGDYYEYGKFVYDTVKEYNDYGTYYPVWGTCLGFEFMTAYESSEGISVLDKYYVPHSSMSLQFLKDPRHT